MWSARRVFQLLLASKLRITYKKQEATQMSHYVTLKPYSLQTEGTIIQSVLGVTCGQHVVFQFLLAL